ncbi:MAG: SRPBCC family protein [Tetrasphaera sp.]
MTQLNTDPRAATIAADPTVPAIHITRDFRATPAQLIRAHTDPEIVPLWMGPAKRTMAVDYWDARSGGSWRYVDTTDDVELGFHGCFHEISDERIVQTFTFEGMPEGVALETMTFEDLGDGLTRLHAKSLCDSFEARDGWLASGMETGVDEGYRALDGLLTEGRV